MKKLAKMRSIMLVLILILMAFITKTYLLKKDEFGKEKQDVTQKDMQYSKETLQDKSIKVQKIAENISNEIEIIVLKETGNIQLFHDKTPENNKYIEWVIDSNITIKVKYTAILTINTENIEVIYDENTDKINIIYDLQKINVISVNIDEILFKTSKGIFGKKYSEKETSSLILFSTEQIKEELSNSEDIKVIASINLQEHLRCMAYKLGVFNISVIEK